MLMKTHMAIGVFAVIFFFPYMNNKAIFSLAVLIASLLPDVDSGFSTMGRNMVMKPLQVLTRHRGIFHSFTFCIVVSLFFSFYLPVLAFGFFLGYALHLLADSWTPEGIKPFWPLKNDLMGKVRVGGVIEETVFIVFAILDVIFFILLFV